MTEQPVVETNYLCSLCSEIAGSVQLFGSARDNKLLRSSFTSQLSCAIDAGSFEHLRTVIAASDVCALYVFDPELASFYCPQCGVSYCKNHWVSWDVFEDDDGFWWFDCIRGRCPKGHERMLED